MERTDKRQSEESNSMIVQVDSDLDVTGKITAPTTFLGDEICNIELKSDAEQGERLLITLPTTGKGRPEIGKTQTYDMRSIIESIQELNRRTATFNCNVSFNTALEAFDVSSEPNDMFACDLEADGLPAAKMGEIDTGSTNNLYKVPLVATDHNDAEIYILNNGDATNSITIGLNNSEMEKLYHALGSVHTDNSGTIITHKLELSNEYITMIGYPENKLEGTSDFFENLNNTNIPYRYGFDGERIILIYYGKGAFYLDVPSKKMIQISDLKYVYDIYKTNITVSTGTNTYITIPVYILAALREDSNGNIILCPTIQILNESFDYITAWNPEDKSDYIIKDHTFAETYLPRIIEINRDTVDNMIHIRTPVQYTQGSNTYIKIYLTTFKYTFPTSVSLPQINGTAYHTVIIAATQSFNANNLKWLDFGYTLTNGNTLYYISGKPTGNYSLTTVNINSNLSSTLIEHSQWYDKSTIFSLLLLQTTGTNNPDSIKYILRDRNSIPTDNTIKTIVKDFPFPDGFTPNYSGVRILAVERGNSNCFIVFTGNGIFRCEVSNPGNGKYDLTVTYVNSDLTYDDKLLALIYNSDGYVYAISDKRIVKCIYKSDKTITTSTIDTDEKFKFDGPIDAMEVGFLYNKTPYSIKDVPIIPRLNIN